MSEKLTNQKVLIIGGNSGMGYGAAEEVIQEGGRVVVVGSSPEKVDKAVADLGSLASGIAADMTDEQSLVSLADQLDKVDHLFISASPGGTSEFSKLDFNIKKSYFYGKVWGTIMAVKTLLPKLNASGSITLLTGGMAVRPDGRYGVVTAAYGAIESLTRALAAELAPVRVNTIRPGTIDSSLWDYMEKEEKTNFLKEEATLNPLHKIGTINDIGRAAVFLMTNEFINGEILEVSGGKHIL